MPRKKPEGHPPIRQSLEDVVAAHKELSPHLIAVVTLARAVADELATRIAECVAASG